MSKQWFVLNTLTGQEQKVQRLIAAKIREGIKTVDPVTHETKVLDISPFIGETLVPTERVVSMKSSRKTTVTKKLFPGYVFIELELYLDDRHRKLNKDVWEAVNLIDGVIGFLGAERNVRGEMIRPPLPMSEAEVQNLKGQTGETEAKAKPKIDFQPGETVKIADGAFLGSIATVQSVDPDHGRLTVSVTIFGGDTPVELEYWQVEKVEKTEKNEGEAVPEA